MSVRMRAEVALVVGRRVVHNACLLLSRKRREGEGALFTAHDPLSRESAGRGGGVPWMGGKRSAGRVRSLHVVGLMLPCAGSEHVARLVLPRAGSVVD